MDKNVNLNTAIKTSNELEEALEKFTNTIHEAAHLSTPQKTQQTSHKVFLSVEVRNMIKHKRRLRKIWQTTRSPADKRNLNVAVKNLKERLAEIKSEAFKEFLKNLSPTKYDEHQLWKATKYLKRPPKRSVPVRDQHNSWCRSDKSKAEAFSQYLFDTFQPFSTASDSEVREITEFLDIPCQMELPIRHIRPNEVSNEIKYLQNNKSPGYDKIDAKTVKLLSKKSVLFLTLIFNSILRLHHFPSQWKCAEIIMINKPNKPENTITSYRPISLLVVFSKIFEKIFLRRMLSVLAKTNIVPEHQFGFRHKHGTIEQCHRIVNTIRDGLESKEYCSAVFLDIKQAFDRVWHAGLLFKIKKLLPAPYYLTIKSYLNNRTFYVKSGDETSNIKEIHAGVPQGSVIGPVLYTIFTSDIPVSNDTILATYADDTAIIAKHNVPFTASSILQEHITAIEKWLAKWNIMVNCDKSVHITFTLRHNECPPVMINGNIIPKKEVVKYLGLYLDKRLTWKEHIKSKRQLLDKKNKRLYWLIGYRSELSLENKLRIYKAILKPVWTYGLQLWGTASNSNIEILQRYQSSTLRLILKAPWFITNEAIHKDLNMPTVKEEIKKFSTRYLDRLSNHVNTLAINLLDDSNEINRLKRHHVLDLPFRNN